MLPSPLVTAAHSTRATSALMPKMQDKITKMLGMEVKDAVSVRAYLMNRAYVVEGAENSMDMLSMVVLQLFQMQKLPKPVMEAFQALAFLIDNAHQKQLVGMMMDLVEKSLDTMLECAKLMMEEVSDNLLSATNTIDEFQEECQRLTADLKEAMEEAVEVIGEAPGRQVDERWEKSPEPVGGGTYADQVRRNVASLLLMHAMAIA